jgi:uncharacterized cupin superfamily protein
MKHWIVVNKSDDIFTVLKGSEVTVISDKRNVDDLEKGDAVRFKNGVIARVLDKKSNDVSKAYLISNTRVSVHKWKETLKESKFLDKKSQNETNKQV